MEKRDTYSQVSRCPEVAARRGGCFNSEKSKKRELLSTGKRDGENQVKRNAIHQERSYMTLGKI